MKKKISTKKTKLASAQKKRRLAQPRLIHRDRKDLQLKDYLMEDHPELSLPRAAAGSTKADRVSLLNKK